jgi:hypothetical protein
LRHYDTSQRVTGSRGELFLSIFLIFVASLGLEDYPSLIEESTGDKNKNVSAEQSATGA